MGVQSDPSSGSTRREWLTGVSAAMSATSAASAQTGGNVKRPNIVLIISDQFRCDCVGAMGLNPMNLTPNLDAMAGRGVLFRSAFSNQPVCAPARGSIFTGQYPSRHGVWHNGPGLAEDATTLATALGQAGYSTNYIGKWHLAPGEGRPRDGSAGRRGAGPSRRFPGSVGSVEPVGVDLPRLRGRSLRQRRQAHPLLRPVPGGLHDRARAALPAVGEIAVPAGGVVSRGPPPERQRHLRSAEGVRPSLSESVHPARPAGASGFVAQPVIGLLRLRGEDRRRGRQHPQDAGGNRAGPQHHPGLHERSRQPLQDAQYGIQAQPARELDSHPSHHRRPGVQPIAWRFPNW